MVPDLTGKLIVITGAAGGIGRACIEQFEAVGANFLLIDNNGDALTQLARDLDLGDRVTVHVSAIDTPESCAAAVGTREGSIFALIHLAGIFVADALEPDDRREVFDPVIAANLTNAYDMTIACLPRLDTDNLGRIVMASSLAYRRGAHAHSAYSAAKGGIAGLTRSLARRLAPTILVNALAPGLIDTPMPADLLAANRDRIIREIPLNRLGTAEEIAMVILFLCGPGGKYITGQVINVDGGFAMS